MERHTYNYINSMIRKKSVYSMLILISLITTPLIAIGWDVGTSGGGYLSIPGEIQEDSVTPLMSASISLIYSPLVIQISPEVLLNIPLQVTYTSRSQLYGPIYFKDFTTIASGLEFTLGITKPISISLSMLYAIQVKDDE